MREESFGKNYCRGGAVKEKVIPLDAGAGEGGERDFAHTLRAVGCSGHLLPLSLVNLFIILGPVSRFDAWRPRQDSNLESPLRRQ